MLPLPATRQLGARSSLLLHTYPSFYACYLLKSIQTPQSTTVYIGSTPSPPRRIRQHNGELAAGARKTQRKRPWVMQMIVHGFPSRLAALQFEWVWQHPHKSRHMRDENGRFFGTRRCRDMKRNIAIVRSMVGRHPFNTWALHVKLFTAEAVHYWNAAEFLPTVPQLPPGLTCSIELEGVDGKSGHPGSGRTGPLAADDDEFTAALLAKNTALLASGRNLECSVCHEPLHTYDSDPLSTTICPTTGCTSVAHLTCLAQRFLAEEQGESTAIIPRGGYCDSCGEYTLWGEIVRGCYRRVPPVDPNDLPDVASDDMFVTDEDAELLEATPRKRKSKSPSASRKGKQRADESTEGESFDFDGIVSSSDSESDGVTPMRRQPRRRRKSDVALVPVPIALEKTSKARKQRTVPSTSSFVVKVTSARPRGRPAKNKSGTQTLSVSSEGESFDFDNISSSSEGNTPVAKRRPGRPRKSDSPSQINVVQKLVSVGPANNSSEGEFFDFDNISATSSLVSEASPPKRHPGRPRKSASPINVPPSPTRRPGRPAKTAFPVDLSPPSKRRPGRPPKTASPAVHSPLPFRRPARPPETVSPVTLPPSPTRRPGRPRKIVSPEDPWAPRSKTPGRPRKSASPMDQVVLPDALLPSPIISQSGSAREGTAKMSSLNDNDAMTAEKLKARNAGGIIDIDSASDSGSGGMPPKRRPGRPRKHSATAQPRPMGVGPTVMQRPIGADMGPSARSYFHTAMSTPSKTLGGAPSSSGSSSEIEILPYVYSSPKKTRTGGSAQDNPAPIDTTPTRAGRHLTRLPGAPLDHALGHAMAGLSLTSPSQGRNDQIIEVIELSD